MKNITLKKVAEVCRGSLHGGAEREEEATCVVIDSRKLKAGGIFIAARGAAVDGHSFIPQAAAQKALGVVCEKAPSESEIPGDYRECGKNQHQGIHRRRAFGEIPGIKNRREF